MTEFVENQITNRRHARIWRPRFGSRGVTFCGSWNFSFEVHQGGAHSSKTQTIQAAGVTFAAKRGPCRPESGDDQSLAHMANA
jgi:hypothetical protein